MNSFRISSIASIAIFLTTLSQADQRQCFIAQTIDDNIQIGYGLAIGDVDGDGAIAEFCLNSKIRNTRPARTATLLSTVVRIWTVLDFMMPPQLMETYA